MVFIVFVVGGIILYFSIKMKNVIGGIVGTIIILTALGIWLPNLYPSLGTLVMDVARAIGKFFSNVGKGA